MITATTPDTPMARAYGAAAMKAFSQNETNSSFSSTFSFLRVYFDMSGPNHCQILSLCKSVSRMSSISAFREQIARGS